MERRKTDEHIFEARETVLYLCQLLDQIQRHHIPATDISFDFYAQILICLSAIDPEDRIEFYCDIQSAFDEPMDLSQCPNLSDLERRIDTHFDLGFEMRHQFKDSEAYLRYLRDWQFRLQK